MRKIQIVLQILTSQILLKINLKILKTRHIHKNIEVKLLTKQDLIIINS